MLDGPGLDDLPAQALNLNEGSFFILAHERGEAHHVSRKNGCQTSLDLWLARAAHVRSPRGRFDGASLRLLRPGKEINKAKLERLASRGTVGGISGLLDSLPITRNMLPAWIDDCFPEVVPWSALPAASRRSFNWLYSAFDPLQPFRRWI